MNCIPGTACKLLVGLGSKLAGGDKYESYDTPIINSRRLAPDQRGPISTLKANWRKGLVVLAVELWL